MTALEPKQLQPCWEIPFEGAWPTAVAFLGDQRLAAGNQAGQIVLWELPDDKAASPKPIRLLDGHTNGVTRLVSLSDGRTLISASLDHTLRFWDADGATTSTVDLVLDGDTRAKQRKNSGQKDTDDSGGIPVAVSKASSVLTAHQDWIQALGLSRDESRLITGDDRCLSIVWDVADRKEIVRWNGHPGDWVMSAALSPRGETAFTAEYCSRRGDFDRPPAQVRFWNAVDGQELHDVLKIKFPEVKTRDNSYGYATKWGKFVGRGFIAADFSPDGQLLAVGQGGEIGTAEVHLIEVATAKHLRSLAKHQYGVTDVRFSPDGRFILSTGRDTTLQISQVADGQEVVRLGKPRGGQFKDWLSALALSPNANRVAAADIAGIVHVWQTSD